VEVDWTEINSAIGQLVNVICVLAHRMGFKFGKHYLHVNGAFSRISLISEPKEKYELFYAQNEKTFNTGMINLL